MRGLILPIVVCLSLLASAGAHTANAFVPQGPYIIDMMVSKMGKAASLRVQQKVQVEDQNISDHAVELNETVSYLFPERFRSDTWYQNTNRVHVSDRTEALTIVEDTIVSRQGNRFDRYKDPLLFRSRELLHKMLLIHGVDVGISSLGRFDDHIAYVIGARYPDESVSQIWVDKERLLPLRWICIYHPENPSAETERVEFVYRNWQKFANDLWYPMRIESYSNQQLIRIIEVRHVQVEASFSPELLNIAYLRSVYKASRTDVQTGKDSSEADEVQRTIDDFKKKFELNNE